MSSDELLLRINVEIDRCILYVLLSEEQRVIQEISCHLLNQERQQRIRASYLCELREKSHKKLERDAAHERFRRSPLGVYAMNWNLLTILSGTACSPFEGGSIGVCAKTPALNHWGLRKIPAKDYMSWAPLGNVVWQSSGIDSDDLDDCS